MTDVCFPSNLQHFDEGAIASIFICEDRLGKPNKDPKSKEGVVLMALVMLKSASLWILASSALMVAFPLPATRLLLHIPLAVCLPPAVQDYPVLVVYRNKDGYIKKNAAN